MRPSTLDPGVKGPPAERARPRSAVVVADDLTGANATGVLLVRRGFRALSLPWDDGVGLEAARRWLAAATGAPAALICDIASRAVPSSEAARRVRAVLQAVRDVADVAPVVAKRIDSTMRGNVGSEVRAALHASGPGAFAVVSPAYPASGRIVVGGYLLVDGVPVTRTGAARDPLAPVRTSHVPTLLQVQQSEPVGHVELAVILEGQVAVEERLRREVAAGRRLVVVDIASDDDVRTVAAALLAVSTELGVAAVCADPGPLTAETLAQRMAAGADGTADAACRQAPGVSRSVPEPGGRRGPVIVVAGSTTELTARQLTALEQATGALLEPVNVSALTGAADGAGDDDDWRREVERLASAIVSGWSRACVGLRTSRGPDDVVRGLTAAQQARLLSGLGMAVKMGLERAQQRFGIPAAGLYVTGGDVTAAVLRALGAAAIELEDQVLPLAALGRLVGGPFAGLHLVSKGGLVGGEDAAIRCVRRLMDAV